jgi:hypothetical protein
MLTGAIKSLLDQYLNVPDSTNDDNAAWSVPFDQDFLVFDAMVDSIE